MTAGETADVHCPGELDQGGNINVYTHFGAEWSHVYTDMDYVFEVEACAVQIEEPKPQRVMGPIESGRCLFVVSAEIEDGSHHGLALQVDEVDAYAPRATGVYNARLGAWEGTASLDKTQQWVYDADKQALQSRAALGGVLFEGFNRNLIVFKNMNMAN